MEESASTHKVIDLMLSIILFHRRYKLSTGNVYAPFLVGSGAVSGKKT